MQVVTYHYIRNTPIGLPHFKYLHIEDFKKQLEYFVARGTVLGAKEFSFSLTNGDFPNEGIALTFDDGLKEHITLAAPILEQLGLSGIFFVSSDTLEKQAVLDVHRIHHLIGAFGGGVIYEALSKFVPQQVLTMSASSVSNNTYRNQENDTATATVKRFLNYIGPAENRSELLSKIEDHLAASMEWNDKFYLNSEDIIDLRRRGHIVASHAASHRLLKLLSPKEQKREIEESFEILELAKQPKEERLFCYPYGGPFSYDGNTLSALASSQYLKAFVIDAKPISASIVKNTPFELPRYDCNMFAHGRVRDVKS